MLPKLRLSALSRVSLELRHEHWHDHVGRYQLTPKTQLVGPGSKRLAASSHKKRRERAEAGTKKRAEEAEDDAALSRQVIYAEMLRQATREAKLKSLLQQSNDCGPSGSRALAERGSYLRLLTLTRHV